MIVSKEIDLNLPLSASQIEMLKKMDSMPVNPDEDCPELTAEQLALFKKVSETKKEERRKQTVTLRLSPQALKRARSLGKGYTSVLSRILESTLSNPDAISRYL